MPAVFGLAMIGVFCLLGMALRRWIPVFRSNLVPAFVLAGLLGMVAMNVGLSDLIAGVDSSLFATLTAQLFILSFISIGLTPGDPAHRAEKGGLSRNGLLRGAWVMGLTWTLVYALQGLLGVGTVAVSGLPSDMDPIYGLIAPFAFAQGPGQAIAFATIFENQGWENAIDVGLAFSSAGFIAAFVVGVPLARWGMRRGIATHAMDISPSVAKGYFDKGEDAEPMGRETTYAGSIDTLTFHVAMMGISYMGAYGLAWLASFIPGFIGETVSGMLFMTGLISAYIVRWVLRLLKIEHLLDRKLQAKITGSGTDLVVVASFMAVQLAVVVEWIVPILITCVVVTGVTAAVVILIGQRYGSDHDFERTMGMFGTLTGTTPTGLALVRILDPRMRTATFGEMGLMNLPELLSLPVVLVISAVFADAMGLPAALGVLAGLVVAYFLIMLFTRSMGKRTWSFARHR